MIADGWSRTLRVATALLIAGTTVAQEPLATQPVTTAPPPPVQSDPLGRIDMRVRALPIATVLEMLAVEARTNIVTSTTVTGSVSANLFGVTLDEALDAILLPNQLAYRRIGKIIYVGTAAEIAANGPPPELRVFQLSYASPAEVTPLIKALLSENGTIAEADDQIGSDARSLFEHAGSDHVVVVDTPEVLDRIETLLATIDDRPQQVLIEATILRATLSETNQLGIDLTMLGGVDFRDVGSTSTSAANLTTGQLPVGRFEETTMNVSSNLIGNFPDGGFTFGIIRNNIAAFVRALEEVTDTTVVANPKVIALNKQEASVIVGRRDGYLTTTVTETAAIQKVEFLETGIQLIIRPLINPDGTVRLDVHPKDSNGGLNASNLPFEETTEAQAQIVVEDGHTVLIGGLFRERTVASRSQLPVLGNVPVLGTLFQRQDDTTVREEVIILLTVRVLKDTPEDQAMMAGLAQDVERVRVGTRAGLMLSGRERLAQAYYQEALRQRELGDADLALLNVRLALHNQSRHIAAIKLREELMGVRAWDNDGTRMRTLIFDMLDADTARDGAAPQPVDLLRPPVDRDLQPAQPLGRDAGSREELTPVQP